MNSSAKFPKNYDRESEDDTPCKRKDSGMEGEPTPSTGVSSSSGAQLSTPTMGVSSSDGAQLPLPSPLAKKKRALSGMPGKSGDDFVSPFVLRERGLKVSLPRSMPRSMGWSNSRMNSSAKFPEKYDKESEDDTPCKRKDSGMEVEATPSTGVSSSGGAQLSTPTMGVSSSDGAQLPLPSPLTKKKHALPGMPGKSDPDAEVIALSPSTLLATNRFVCEVCNKGFQREQNLLLHRRGHNLPWRAKAPRRRAYICPEPTCVHHDPARALGDLTGIKMHFCREHGEKKWRCDRCSKRYALQSDWKKHTKTCGSSKYRCYCGTRFSRRDKFLEHHASCDGFALPPAKEDGISVMPTSAAAANVSASSSSSVMATQQSTLSMFAPSWVAPALQLFTPSPHMSATALLQKALQMGTTSSSSSLSNKQESIGNFEEDKHEEIIRRVDKHGGIVKRANEKHDIMELIMSHDPSNERLTIIGIIGGHGLGKTTLASLVYWDDTVCRFFEARAWMCLSHVFDYEELLRSVMASLIGVSYRLNERDELEELVKEELMGKKFLLVLDDLHENNVEICRRLIPLLSAGDKGSAVMVITSTNMIVGRLGTANAYNLKPLMDEEFLNIAKPNFVEYSPLESITRRIPSECSGFPVFAKAIHGILYSAFAQKCLDDTVESKLAEIFSKPDNHLHHLLDLSYNYLSPNQKRCILYCSMFPRDYTYNKEKLLRLWMSQGFIVPEKEKHGHDNCEDAVDELLHRSFFDLLPSSEVKEQKYVMRDLPSNLARSASGNKFFRAHDHELHCIPQDVHHLSIIPKQCDSEIYFSSFTEFKELSTFLLVHKTLVESIDIQFHVMDVKALDECFRNFRCLKTLDLSHTDIKELPESIGYLNSLCFLGLNNTNIRRLPNSVCNLFKLQTLELQNSAFLVELPHAIKSLNSLYHLDASKEHGPIYVPPGIGQLTKLQTLITFTVGGISWNCKVSELAHLNSLKGYLHIWGLNSVEDAEDAKRACLAEKKLKKLSLEWSHSGEEIESNDQIFVAELVLDALKPHSLLGELNIKGYYGLKFPSWMADHSLSDLVSITLDNCYNCEKLPPLGALPVLRCLFIQNLRRIQSIDYAFCATINHKSFPKLEILKLRDMYNLECWYGVGHGDFPSLRSMSIERCPKLSSIPRFLFISDISVMSCTKLNLPGLQSLQTLKVGNLKQRKCFALPCELRSLLMLEIMHCEHLYSLDGLSRLQSLKHLKFRTCPRLNFVPDEPLPDTLETVDIHSNCYMLSNWRPTGFDELPDASEVNRKFIRRKMPGQRC